MGNLTLKLLIAICTAAAISFFTLEFNKIKQISILGSLRRIGFAMSSIPHGRIETVYNMDILAGSILASILIQIRMGATDDWKEFGVQKYSLLQGIVYAEFVGAISVTATTFLQAYMSHMMYLLKKEVASHCLIQLFLGLTFGYFSNTIWFRVLRSAVPVIAYDSQNTHASLKFFLSTAPLILTGIVVTSGFIMHSYCNNHNIPNDNYNKGQKSKKH